MFAQSPFLQALGFAIINSLWQYSIIWLLYVLSNFFKLTAAQKYLTAFVLQIAGFGWFITTFLYYYAQCINASLSFTTSPIISLEHIFYSGSSIKKLVLALVLQGELLLPYLSIAYILLLFILSIKTIKGYKQTQLIRTSGVEKISLEWRLFVNKIALQFGIKQPVKIGVSNLVHSPMTIGFLKPIILLPVAMLNHLSTEQIEAVLVHELAHISRHDYINNLIISIVEVVLFFNPFVQLLCRQLRKERENCCDDCVLNYKYNATSYATALLIIARSNNLKLNQFAMAATYSGDYSLLKRVKRMIEKKHDTGNYKQLVALLFITCSLCTLALITQVKLHNRYGDLQIADLTVTPSKPLTSTVENPFFNPVFFLAEKENQAGLPTKNSRTELIKNNAIKALELKVRSLTNSDRSTPELTSVVVLSNSNKSKLIAFNEQKSLSWNSDLGFIEKLKSDINYGAKAKKNFRFDIAKNNNVPYRIIIEMDSIGITLDEVKQNSIQVLAKNDVARLQHEDVEIDAQNSLAAISNIEVNSGSNIAVSAPNVPSYVQISADIPDDILPPEPMVEKWSYSYNEKPRIIILPNISATFTIPSETSDRGNIKPAQTFKAREVFSDSLQKKTIKLKRKVAVRI